VELGLARVMIGFERVEIAVAERAEIVVVIDELAAAPAEAKARRDPAALSHGS
jgi:hypothetical protein